MDEGKGVFLQKRSAFVANWSYVVLWLQVSHPTQLQEIKPQTHLQACLNYHSQLLPLSDAQPKLRQRRSPFPHICPFNEGMYSP